MESAISSLILFSLGIFAALTISHTYLDVQDQLWRRERTSQDMLLQRARTDLALVTTGTQNNGSDVVVTLRNTGQVKLADFDRWDLFVHYYSNGVPPNDPALYNYHLVRLPYVEGTPTNLEWTVTGIYVDAAAQTAEIVEPDILNPGEEMVIQAKLFPSVALTTTNSILVSSPNGIQVSGFFSR
jgi:hypothetical protein